jgi:hypothetical protein
MLRALALRSRTAEVTTANAEAEMGDGARRSNSRRPAVVNFGDALGALETFA